MPKITTKQKITGGIVLLLMAVYWLWLPSKLFSVSYSKVLLDQNNELLAAQIASDGQWRFPQTDSVPYKFRHCITQFEDEYFYYHPGINPISIFKSLKRNFGAGRIKSGGSTITMQVARMMRLNQPRNYYQKFVEMLLACRIELSYKKNSILNLYCANAPFGGNVVGLSAAAWRYFGRNPERLSWAESAVLAVLPNAPSLIYPGKNHQKLLQKRNRLLKKLFENRIIDQSTYQLAVIEPLPQKPFPVPQSAPHLLARCVKEHPGQDYFISTLSQNIQLRAAEELNRHMTAMHANQIHNACALIADINTGNVLAYIGNSFSQTNEYQNYVDIVASPRSTGSILKPFLFAFMLSENRLLPASLIEDVPIQIGSYGPRNFNLDYDGLVPANQAIARSLNVPAVKMLQDYGPARFHQRLKQLGFTTFTKPANHYGLSLILGGGEATLWELGSAYASIGRVLNEYNVAKGRYSRNSYHPLYYLKPPELLPESMSQKSGLLKASALYYTLSSMSELLRPQDFAGWQFTSANKISWKTGTSFGFRDAWAIGLNSRYLVAVWVGNASGEGRPELTGTSAAAPLMFSLFNTLPAAPWFPKPLGDLEKVKTCVASGYRASEICDVTAVYDYPSGAHATKPCPFHRLVFLDKTSAFRVNSNCYPVHDMQVKPWMMLTPMQEFYFRRHSSNYRPLPPYLPVCQPELTYHQMEIVYPREGFKLYMPVDQSNFKTNCVFKITHKNNLAVIYWYLDGGYIGSTQKYHQLSLQPVRGDHVLEAVDNLGENAQCRFTVVDK